MDDEEIAERDRIEALRARIIAATLRATPEQLRAIAALLDG